MATKTMRIPKYGDEVYLPSLHPDGHWCNGIVNSGYGGTPHRDGNLLIAAPGHAKSNLVLVAVDRYGEGWRWPEDCGQTPRGAKPALLSDVEG